MNKSNLRISAISVRKYFPQISQMNADQKKHFVRLQILLPHIAKVFLQRFNQHEQIKSANICVICGKNFPQIAQMNAD